jgi:hypothetical protein
MEDYRRARLWNEVDDFWYTTAIDKTALPDTRADRLRLYADHVAWCEYALKMGADAVDHALSPAELDILDQMVLENPSSTDALLEPRAASAPL